MKKSVCAVIVTYHIGKELLKCFSSIENQVEEVVIIDNGADEETISVLTSLEKTHDNVTIFYNEVNLGIAAALNIGVRYAIDKGYMWILTLDHDSEATPHMVEKLLDAYLMLSKQHVDNIGIIAANPFDINIQKHLINQKLFDADCEVVGVERAISSGSLINFSVFKDVGFFNESLFLYYVDDDFCLRCRNKKWKIFVCRSPVLFHEEGTKKIKKFLLKKFCYYNYNSHARYYASRNTIYMLRVYFKHHRYKGCYYIIRRMFNDTIKIILFDNNKTNMIFYSIKGVFDGIRGKYGKLTVGDSNRRNMN